ncbi:CdiA C-terminal domain-containing protein [Humibacillus xanthopallidus]|uniref:tRNA nuclease CdiA C-terminal domain-containing protein n=1 Tax=Humibacillus xanthopallidus TaxID=412689 RepID=A0A543HJY4_9MICO|nr:hypothetical protein [Humibacillus xanthopallidus]TQM58590.1 hypothetical protein FBY41_3961 [Humibacillus xanthopallidus]
MTRGHASGAGGSTSGAGALPTPPGDATTLRGAAMRLRRAAQAARGTGSLRGRLATVLPQVWSGAAAEAAVTESTELVRRSTSALERLPAAARALERYASALEHGQDAVRLLQREWDHTTEEHNRTVAAVRLRAGVDLDAVPLLARLTEEQQGARARLSHRHAELVAELDRAGLRAAATLASLNDEGLPRSLDPRPMSLRDRLIHGQQLATGAARASDTRASAVAGATVLRRLLARGAGSVTVVEVGDLVRTLQPHSGDPVYAQALVEEIGVDGVNRLVVLLGDASGSSGLDLTRQAVGALGVVLLTAVAPPSSSTRDARTARQVESAAALLRDDLVAALAEVVGGGATRSRATGYWAVGQLVVGARQSGWSEPLPTALLARLAAGAASAEIGEARDDDAQRAHGSSFDTGGHRFASLFDDPDVTGDALHTFLAEIDDDTAGVTDLLSTPVEGHGLTNSRGGRLVLAEALTRRWVSYEASTTATHSDLSLATDADLIRLMAVAGGSSEPAAVLRARVMSEVGRLDAFAQREHSTTAVYEHSTAGLESAAVTWVIAMPDAIDLLLRGTDVEVDAWSVKVGEGHQPLLRPDELSRLVGAFAVGADTTRAGKATAAGYRRLIESELGRAGLPGAAAQASVATGPALDRLTRRIGYFEQSASAALVTVARRQDAANLSMWRTLAEAKALAIAWRQGPKGLGSALATLLSGGTNRTAEDDLAISLIRSDVELEQTSVDEQRTASLASSLDALRPEAARAALPTGALLVAGARRAPAVATSDQLVGLRRKEQLDALALVLEDGSTSKHQARTLRASSPEAHELYTAERLRRAGFTVEFLPRADDAKSPDALVGGESWEFKAPFGGGSSTITQAVRYARDQSPRIIVDLARSPHPVEEAVRQVDAALRRYDRIDVVLLLTRDGEIVERRP